MSDDWRDKAACLEGTDWFPGLNKLGKRDKEAARRALLICVQKCPVRRDCAADALDADAPTGIWAGVDLGDAEGRVMRKEKRDQLERIKAGGV